MFLPIIVNLQYHLIYSLYTFVWGSSPFSVSVHYSLWIILLDTLVSCNHICIFTYMAPIVLHCIGQFWGDNPLAKFFINISSKGTSLEKCVIWAVNDVFWVPFDMRTCNKTRKKLNELKQMLYFTQTWGGAILDGNHFWFVWRSFQHN
jgi:hypothetical protein